MVFNDAELRSRIDKLEEYVRGLQSVNSDANVAVNRLNVEYKYQKCKGCRVVIAVYVSRPDSLFYGYEFGDDVVKYWCPSCEPMERKRRLARSIAEKSPDCVIAAWEEKAKVKGGKK